MQLEKSIVGTLMLMEQYLDGPEVDVDLVMSQGEAVYGILTDNWFEPWRHSFTRPKFFTSSVP